MRYIFRSAIGDSILFRDIFRATKKSDCNGRDFSALQESNSSNKPVFGGRVGR
jgi:hypothetical protein